MTQIDDVIFVIGAVPSGHSLYTMRQLANHAGCQQHATWCFRADS